MQVFLGLACSVDTTGGVPLSLHMQQAKSARELGYSEQFQLMTDGMCG